LGDPIEGLAAEASSAFEIGPQPVRAARALLTGRSLVFDFDFDA
jgi:hypothetical protein